MYSECCTIQPEVRYLKWRPPIQDIHIYQLVDKMGTEFNDYIHVFEVQLFNGIIKNVEEPNLKCEFQDAVLQIGSAHISAR